MPTAIINCPIDGCPYATPDVEAVVAAALITTHATTHAAAPPQHVTAARPEKVKRPTISSAGTSEEWSYFQSRWSDYVEATRVTGKDKIIQLLECCDDELRKDITRMAGGTLTNKTEEEVLAAIKRLAVREENTMVARVTLHNMHQDHDEPIRSFGARLRGQAAVCKFLIKCTNCDHDVNYTEPVICDCVTKGLVDSDIQLDLLGDNNQTMTLEETLKFVEAKESGKRSASRLHESQMHGTAAASSSYRRDMKKAMKERASGPPKKSDKKESCHHCGQSGHGMRSHTNIRKKECPAFGHTCKHCDKQNHYNHMCQSKYKPKPSRTSTDEAEGAVFDSLCTMTTYDPVNDKSITLDHHMYNQLSDTWTRQSSKPQPFVQLTVGAYSADYDRFGIELTSKLRTSVIPCMADTGCQSCLASVKVIQRLGIRPQDLIPVKLKMHAANNKGIKILGAAILRFTGKDKNGTTLETRQITYVTDSSDRLFLSKEACIHLGMITDNFPTVGEVNIQPSTHSVSDEQSHSGLTSECDCPRRELPPAPPRQVPFPATMSNRDSMQQFLVDHYKSSTFNTCEHQPLPMMEGPPLQLMIATDAKPVAHHTPIPEPVHWQDDVKAGLDRDVRLGVLEPVPVGEPVTWCHRMVICAKKNGKPRRTVDMQSLNQHATRETPHTVSFPSG
ncbi:MAG: hypothetical protein DRI57_19860 [Deltaproteobacteria bacterium]|nr:MAG: hypothetical protein DRI57_19860 [Deltaproteobacteria bacterium]